MVGNRPVRRKRAIVFALVGTLVVLGASMPVLNHVLASDVAFAGVADAVAVGFDWFVGCSVGGQAGEDLVEVGD
ncbi:hypothetical protein ACFQ1S_35115, partial [Kibdelosporangium lantanae]